MPRKARLRFALTGLLLLMGAAGCKQAAQESEVVLALPESIVVEGHPDRVTKLLVDDREVELKAANLQYPTTHTMKVKPADNPKVTIVYDHWPNMYTNIIRTKVVPVDGAKIHANLNAEDPATPDKIKPIYFPTPYSVVEKMCDMAKVGKNDIVYDVGCGDGRLVVMAVKKYGAKKGVGIDINPERLKECRENAEKEGVTDRTEFRNDDALNIKDLSEATVVLLYLGDDLNLKLRPILQKTLKPGSRVVSHRFRMGDWKPDVSTQIIAKNNWDLDEPYELHLWKIK